VIDNPATGDEEIEGQAAIDEEPGDPGATDIGDALHVPESERLDVDEPEPNEDADDDLADVEED
jgi:hypothetical protein